MRVKLHTSLSRALDSLDLPCTPSMDAARKDAIGQAMGDEGQEQMTTAARRGRVRHGCGLSELRNALRIEDCADDLVLVHVLRDGGPGAEPEAMAGMGVRWLDCGAGPTEPGCGPHPLAKLQSDADLDALWFFLERSDAVQHPYRLDVAIVRG